MNATRELISVPAAVAVAIQAILEARGVERLDLPGQLAWMRRNGHSEAYEWLIRHPREYARAMTFGFEIG